MVMGDGPAHRCPKTIPCRFLSPLRAPLSRRSGRPGEAVLWQPFALRQLWTAKCEMQVLGVRCCSRLCPTLWWELRWSSPSTETVSAVCCPHQGGTGSQGCGHGQCCSGVAPLHGAVRGHSKMAGLQFPQPRGTRWGCPGPGLQNRRGVSCRSCSG